MRIAVIDSGIDINHRRLKDCRICGLSIKWNKGKIIFENDYEDHLGHGTGVASIIHKLNPIAEIVSIKIFHDHLVAKIEILISAINWCCENRIDIINASFGIFSETPPQKLHEVCKKAFELNIPIIAAGGDNISKECYPAFFPEVFGVYSGNVKNGNSYGKVEDSPVEFIAKGDNQRIATNNDTFIFREGSSYACAYFSGIVANRICKSKKKYPINKFKELLLNECDSNIKIYRTLKKNIISPIIINHDINELAYELFNNNMKLSDFGQLALFPVSEKEMKSMMNLKELCKCRISLYLDYPRRFKENNGDIAIQDWELSDEDINKFDTLVIGYFYEHFFRANVDFGYRILKKAVEWNKNLFFYDSNLKSIVEKELITTEYTGKIYCPIVNTKTLKLLSFFKSQPNIKTPVLCVVGTTKSQGKFTTQLIIKTLLESEGYSIAHISTEPQGELFGSIYSFPFGYNSTISIPHKFWCIFLRLLNKAIEYYNNPDLILSGIQSWALPMAFPEAATGQELDSLYYLIGLDPDAIICAINPNDPIERIQRNITATQLVTKSKILFCTITPWQIEYNMNNKKVLVSNRKILLEDELNERISFYQNQLKMPVINIMDEKNKQFILDTIYNYFS